MVNYSENFSGTAENLSTASKKSSAAISELSKMSNDIAIVISEETISLKKIDENIEKTANEQYQKSIEIDDVVKWVSEEAGLISEHSEKIAKLAKDKFRTAKFLKDITSDFNIDGKTLIVWDDALSVNIDEVDKQHKGLVKILNHLYNLVQQNSDRSDINPVFEKLIEYTMVHFKYEEDLFEKYSYPGANEHKKEHKKLTEQVVAFKKQYDDGSESISFELLDFLRKWLTNHILGSDKMYSKFFNLKGIQ